MKCEWEEIEDRVEQCFVRFQPTLPPVVMIEIYDFHESPMIIDEDDGPKRPKKQIIIRCGQTHKMLASKTVHIADSFGDDPRKEAKKLLATLFETTVDSIE